MAFLKRLNFVDIIFLLLFPLMAVFVSVRIVNSYALSSILFYALPGIYLSLRFGHLWQEKKGLLFVILFSIPFTIIVDYIGIRSGLWYTPYSTLSVRFLGTIPWEDFLWMIAGAYSITMIYETLLDKGKHELVDRRVLYFVLVAAIALAAFFLLLIIGETEFFVYSSKYTYLILASTFFLLPAILFIWKFPKYLKRLLPLSAYFLYLTVLFEITATYLHQWVFVGNYLIPPLNIFGTAPVAFEELFFVGIIGPMAAVAFYEFFDNGKK